VCPSMCVLILVMGKRLVAPFCVARCVGRVVLVFPCGGQVDMPALSLWPKRFCHPAMRRCVMASRLGRRSGLGQGGARGHVGRRQTDRQGLLVNATSPLLMGCFLWLVPLLDWVAIVDGCSLTASIKSTVANGSPTAYTRQAWLLQIADNQSDLLLGRMDRCAGEILSAVIDASVMHASIGSRM